MSWLTTVADTTSDDLIRQDEDVDGDHEDDPFDDDERLPTQQLASMTLDTGSSSTKQVKAKAKANGTKQKAAASTAPMSLAERVRNKFGGTTIAAPKLSVRKEKLLL